MINGHLSIVVANWFLLDCCFIIEIGKFIGVFPIPCAKSEQLWAVEQVLEYKCKYAQVEIACNA